MPDLFENQAQAVLWAALLLGLGFGAIAQWSQFCAVRSLHDWWYRHQKGRLGAFILAMMTALLASQLLAYTTPIDFSDSHVTARSTALLLVPVGGLLFGLGMSLSNACGARSLVLLGEGNLRSLVVLLSLGLGAAMTLSGLIAPARIWMEDLLRFPLPATTLPELIHGTGLSLSMATLAAVAITLLILAAILLRGCRADLKRQDWLGGILVGLLVAAGWWITGVLGHDDFDPHRLISLTFVAPIGDSLQYLMLSTGTRLQFGVVVVFGIVAGSLAPALLSGNFRWQGFHSTGQLGKAIGGGLLMGIGGVMALGCTLGQGLSGFSTLALSSFLAIAGIVVGARFGFSLQSQP